MALADSVPGVSGGTIAFIIGIYDDFINSLGTALSKNKEERKKAWSFLIKLLLGWVVGMGLAAVAISSVFEAHIYAMSSLFFGFVLASIPLIVMEEKETIKGKWLQALWILAGAALVGGITYLSTHTLGGVESLAWGKLSFGNMVYIFLVGAFAISAMVLPGISGSSVMLIFGVYLAVIDAIKNFLKLDFSYFGGLCALGLGILVGIVTVVKVLKYLLKNHRACVVYFIIGMMAASLYAIIMGPASPSLEEPKSPMTLKTFSVIWFVAGVLLITGLQALKKRMAKQVEKKMTVV